MKIKEYINSCGLTQAEFSKLLGVSESHICQIIKGIKNPSVKLSKKIEKITYGKISVIELLDIAVYKEEK